MADVAAMRERPSRFIAEIRGERLADWQEFEVDSAPSSPLNAWLWSRQAGKSLCLSSVGLWVCFRQPGSLVVILSGSGELGSRRLLRMAKELCLGHPLTRSAIVDEYEGRLALSNGSELRALAASETAVRGWSADCLLIDEATERIRRFGLVGGVAGHLGEAWRVRHHGRHGLEGRGRLLLHMPGWRGGSGGDSLLPSGHSPTRR